ncbi:MAG: hypothetical protein Kow0027_26830 [Saprospiraceae bacterium]
MARIIFFAVLFMMSGVEVYAQSCCATGAVAACTGSASSLESFRKNTLGLRWVRAPFESQLAEEPAFTDKFHLAELFGRYHFNKRLSVSARLPYRWNVRQTGNETEVLDGLADIRLMGHYNLVDSKGKKARTLLNAALGIKLPTGRYVKDIGYRDLPGNFNLGTGNYALLLQASLLHQWENFGLNLSANYQLNGKSNDDYQYGDQTVASALFFFEKKLGKDLHMMPLAGATWEHFAVNYKASGNLAEGSGGEGLFGQLGLGLKARDWQLAGTFFLPLAQSYADDQIKANERISLELTRFF